MLKSNTGQECIPVGCVPSAAVTVSRGGGLLQGGLWGVSAPEGVYTRGCLLKGVSAPGGCLLRGVSAPGGCLLLGGGVCSWGVSTLAGVCSQRDVVCQHALRQTPPVDRHMPVKT